LGVDDVSELSINFTHSIFSNPSIFRDICDRVNADPKGPKQCLLSLKKRLNHRDPHVVLLALSLLDCLWNNCGQKFRHEISSKEFIDELSYKCTNVKQTPKERKAKGKKNNDRFEVYTFSINFNINLIVKIGNIP
jgi:predicted transcriptional regulator with HTH domain